MSSNELSKSYEPKAVEQAWYDYWLKKKYFHAEENAGGRHFSIVIPPPNVTGQLHIGHALNSTIQDILVRWMRMSGRNTLWVPGTDHAGIATQNVVERMLAKNDVDRHMMGREAFVAEVWKWKQEYGSRIINQLKRMGASCDWDRERFTMDEGLSKAVLNVFVTLYEEGLIYRGERLINWCPRCHTALSDIEVEHEDEKGKLYHISYPLSHDHSVRLTVATTRPETMLGDTAVAVHPLDPRYKDLIGKTVNLPLTGRKIPIIGDSILVDLEFGTGAVKVTPAHDFNDAEAGLRQIPQLARIKMLNENAEVAMDIPDILPDVRKLVFGKPAKKARGIIVELLNEKGYLIKTEDHAHSIGKCYRCKTIVEPYLSPQWFVKTQPLAEPAIKAVEDGTITFFPKGWENTYFDWMRNIKDWCISRQIWWGHQIPAWYCKKCDSDVLEAHIGAGVAIEGGPMPAPTERVLTIGINAKPIVQKEDPKKCPRCGSADIVRDPDVLDTWFSSALWPFSTLGWPERTKELVAYYPTSVLVTSFDIIFFWVARMIMMGLHFMKEVPFRDVYIHALVRDVEGQKMSKSKGNVIDPLEMTEQFGTDAFRFTLAAFAAQGRDIKMSAERIEGYRNFANKIWNASRFVMMNMGEGFVPNDELVNKYSTRADKWIVSRLQTVIKEVNLALEEYRFNDAASSLYQFIWHEYCDWYVELSKGALKGSDAAVRKATQTTLVATLESTLRLLHPIMPFITEEIWQKLPAGVKGNVSSIMVSPFPEADEKLISPESERYMKPSMDINLSLRNIRGEMGIPPSARPEAIIKPETEEAFNIIEETKSYITSLSGLSNIHVAMDAIFPSGSATSATVWAVSGMFLPEKALDVNAERDRLMKEIAKISKDIDVFSKKLSNKNFVDKAPKEVVEKDTVKLEEFKAKHEKLEQRLAALGS